MMSSDVQKLYLASLMVSHAVLKEGFAEFEDIQTMKSAEMRSRIKIKRSHCVMIHTTPSLEHPLPYGSSVESSSVHAVIAIVKSMLIWPTKTSRPSWTPLYAERKRTLTIPFLHSCLHSGDMLSETNKACTALLLHDIPLHTE